jgi:SSS family solute:Na+ symporter
MVMPFIVVIPGMIAFVLNEAHDPVMVRNIEIPDETYPTLLNSFLFPGVKGLAFAALFAAIVGAISSKTNSIATIFTMDIYRQFINKKASEAALVRTGRIVTALSLVIAIPVVPLLGNFGQVFQYIQEYSGFVSPGVLVLFVFGLFWKRTSANAAVWAAILTIPVGVGLKLFAEDVPFMDRMGITFILLSIVIVGISLIENSGDDVKAIDLNVKDDPDARLAQSDLRHSAAKKSLFYTDPLFNVLAIGIMAMLGVIYYLFW